MEIRILQNEEIKIASGLSRYVFDNCLRNRMEYPQTIAFVEEYIAESNLLRLCEEQKLVLWGAFEGEQLVAVSGIQTDGLVTLLYVLPQYQNRGLGSRMLRIMRTYARDVYHLPKVLINATPAWTSAYFWKRGFSKINANQDMRAPFVSMHAPSSNITGFEKRPVSKATIALAVVGCILFATVVASLYMISYLF